MLKFKGKYVFKNLHLLVYLKNTAKIIICQSRNASEMMVFKNVTSSETMRQTGFLGLTLHSFLNKTHWRKFLIWQGFSSTITQWASKTRSHELHFPIHIAVVMATNLWHIWWCNLHIFQQEKKNSIVAMATAAHQPFSSSMPSQLPLKF